MNKESLFQWIKNIHPDNAVCWATLWGLGTLRAPGTWGSAFGLLFYCVFFYGINLWFSAIFIVLFAYLAIGVCDAAAPALGEDDPHMVNLDEFVAMPLCFLPVAADGFSGLWLLLGFAIFRFLDIKKPSFIKRAENFEGGMGIVFDDLAAAATTAVIINCCYYTFHSFVK